MSESLAPTVLISQSTLSELKSQHETAGGFNYRELEEGGEFALLGILGSGGSSVVLKARQLRLDRIVALKLINPQSGNTPPSSEQALGEARRLAALNHPNIVQVYDVGQFQGNLFIEMEFIDGSTLARYSSGTQLPIDQAALIMETVARAVSFAHGQGIIHRDLKPANILLTAQGTPKIADFGLAILPSRRDDKNLRSIVSGTPGYMAPEQFSGDLQVIDARTDVFSLGAVLYELLVGRPPFRGQSVAAAIQETIHGRLIKPRQLRPTIPRDLQAICCKCLEKDPEQRYQDVATLAEDLKRFLHREDIVARRAPFWERWWRRLKRNPLQLKLSAAFLIVGIVIAEFEYFGYGFVGPGLTDRIHTRIDQNPQLEELARLRQENDELRTERDTLKDRLKTMGTSRDK